MAYWYVSRPDELMLDVDAPTGTGTGVSFERRAYLGPTRIRLEAAIRSGVLRVKSQLYIYPSVTPNHFHVIIPLLEPMEDVRRFVWEMQLRSDLYRGRCNIMRALNRTPAPGLLIAPLPWNHFPRKPDAECACDEKHGMSNFGDCPAARRLRGDEAAHEGYFGALRRDRIVPPMRWSVGLVDTGNFARTHDIDEAAELGLISAVHGAVRTEGT